MIAEATHSPDVVAFFSVAFGGKIVKDLFLAYAGSFSVSVAQGHF